MASRRIEDLHPLLRGPAQEFKDECRKEGLDILIYCTLRSPEEQAALYAIGRTVPGRRVTNAKPGTSAHNYGLAFDGVPMFHGKPVWGTKGAALLMWQEYGAIAESLGLDWAGNWPRFREFPHVQIPNWREYLP